MFGQNTKCASNTLYSLLYYLPLETPYIVLRQDPTVLLKGACRSKSWVEKRCLY